MLHRVNWALMLATLASAFALYAIKYDTRRLEVRVQAQERALEKAESDVDSAGGRARASRPPRASRAPRPPDRPRPHRQPAIRAPRRAAPTDPPRQPAPAAGNSHVRTRRIFASPCVEGIAFVTTRGEDGTPRLSRPPTMLTCRRRAKSDGVPGGGVCHARVTSPPPGTSSDLARPSIAHVGDWRAKPRRSAIPPRRDEGDAFAAGGGDSAASDGASLRAARRRCRAMTAHAAACACGALPLMSARTTAMRACVGARGSCCAACCWHLA